MIRLIASAAITINNIFFVTFLGLLGFRGYKAFSEVLRPEAQQQDLPTTLGTFLQAFSDADVPFILGGLIATGGVALLGALWLEFREARGLSSKSKT